MYTTEQSRAIYAAAYRGCVQDWPRGFDVKYDADDETARPVASGFGNLNTFRNVTADQFGDWTPETMTEGEFASMCLECFGLIEDSYPE